MDTYNNSFDPTPKLKPSPVPVLFIPFDNDENKCNYCGNEHSKTLKYEQKYCKNCLSWYNRYTTGNNACLDIYIITNNVKCTEHGITRNGFDSKNIQEWCEYCSEVSYFKQVIPNTSSFNNHYLSRNCAHNNHSKTTCQLCEIMLQSFDYGPDYYQISSGWVESTLTKKSIPIPILYLPWWDIYDQCLVCSQKLEYIHQNSELNIELYCQRWCSHCFTIYTGCRYCLTINIIFGITNQTQCIKCKKISPINIDITNLVSGNCNIDEFIVSTKINYNNFRSIANYLDNNTNLNPLNLYGYIRNMLYLSKLEGREIKWIPHFQIENKEKIAEGGFSIIYKATYRVGMRDTDVVIKELRDSQNISKYFLNELKSLYRLNNWYSVINCYGITQDPITKGFMLVMEYANGGDLHDHLQNNFIEVSWKDKLSILRYISLGLMQIHKINFVHRDLHSGNILLSDHEMKLEDWKISDLGLSQPADTLSNNEIIYGVIPYIAPEIFKSIKFSKESDVYSLGMIMWELTTGCKPFANFEHDANLVYEIIDGKRPEITNDTPECYANLMKKCWDPIPSNRPTIDEFWNFVIKWFDETSYTIYDGFGIAPEFIEIFKQAEEKRMELIRSKKLGPGFSKKSHSKAIYTSRELSSLICKSSTTDSSPMVTSNITKEYITKAYDYDINMNNIQSSSIQNINSDAQSSIALLNSSRKRNIEELKIDTQNDRKHTKTG